MSNTKGFTLIELTSVIVLIAIIAALTSIPITQLIKDSKKGLSDMQKRHIVLAAQNWGADNTSELPTYTSENLEKRITIEQLYNSGYIDTKIIDLESNNDIKTCSYVSITLIDVPSNPVNTYNYNFIELKEC